MLHIGTLSFVPSLTPQEMQKLEVKRVPQNAGETIEMQVGHHVVFEWVARVTLRSGGLRGWGVIAVNWG